MGAVGNVKVEVVEVVENQREEKKVQLLSDWIH